MRPDAAWLEGVTAEELAGDVAALEEFARLAKSGELWRETAPEAHAGRRRGLRRALDRLLVWGRPWLEAERGIMWPYRLLSETAPALEGVLAGADSVSGLDAAPSLPENARQALLYLALLPCPGSWRRLAWLEGQPGCDAEVEAFLAGEREKTEAKLRAKPDERFRLEHFCQILTPPPPGGKGVLRVFSLPYLFLRAGLLDALSRRWLLFVEPPMGLVFRHAWWRRFTELPEPAVFGVGGPEDVWFLSGQAGARAVDICHGDFMADEDAPASHPIHPSDSIDPLGPRASARSVNSGDPAGSAGPISALSPSSDSFGASFNASPNPPRDFDLVFNSSFDELERKRHRFFLRLLASPELAGRTALMLGRDRAGRAGEIRREAEALGLGDRLTVRTNLRRREVPELLRRCRIGVHLSLYENAARCIYEFLRADLPAAVSSCTAGMNPALFTPMTGRLAPDDAMAATLADMLAHADAFSPRRWFLANSGSAESTRRLEAFLRDFAVGLGLPDPGPLAPLTASGRGRHADPEDFRRFRSLYEEILADFHAAGLDIVHDV